MDWVEYRDRRLAEDSELAGEYKKETARRKRRRGLRRDLIHLYRWEKRHRRQMSWWRKRRKA